MILKFEDYINEGLWSKGVDRSKTGDERLEEQMWYPNGSKYIKLFLKNNKVSDFNDLSLFGNKIAQKDIVNIGKYKEIDFETIAIIIGQLMNMYPEVDFTGSFFYSGYSGYQFNKHNKLLMLMVKRSDDNRIYWDEDFGDKYKFIPPNHKFTEESRKKAIDYMVETGKEYFNL